MDKTILKEIVINQNKTKENINLVERDIYPQIESYTNNPFIIIISGIRRCGKSTLLNQIKEKHQGYYLNFDDERLINFKLEDFQTLYEIFLEIFGKKRTFYFDEIQNVQGWERFVRRLHDEKNKVYLTGSNASMLSKELGTHLTGRYLEISLYPFSFKEFLKIKEFKLEQKETYILENKIKLKKHLDEYLINGGLPEYLITQNKDYLRTLYESILYRDIMARYGLQNEKTLKELIYFVANTIAKEISFNSIKKMLQIGSSTTVKDYFNYFENSFLIFLVTKFDYSLKRQIYFNKKAYLIDTGFAVNLGFRTSKDIGRLLENLIFIELKRRNKDIYYYSENNECDFIIKKDTKISEAIQVCYELNEENRKREIEGLLQAMNKFKLKNGLILTNEQSEEITINNLKIKI